MIEELVKAHSALQPRVLQVHVRWAQFRFLFTTSDDRMKVLSNAAPGFFAIILEVLRDDAFIGLSRLTDNASTPNGNNLTLASLLKLAESSGKDDLVASAGPLLDEIRDQVKNMRKWRNKVLAHTDYDQALLGHPLAKFGVQRGQIDRAIDATIGFMNLFARYLELPFLGTGLPIVAGDADVLARLLESLSDANPGA